jgi:predicted transposase YdaD
MSIPHPFDQSPRNANDNLCKRLAEQAPADFAAWLFGAGGPVKIEKTELSREPIRADAVIFSRAGRETLHAEFQTTMKSDVPVPLRMLDYYVGFKRQHPERRVRQALVVLKETGEAIADRYEDEHTLHRYRVVKLWEQDAAELLKYDGLLPLATLCRARSGEALLAQVAAKIHRLKSRDQRRETLNWSRMLAGLRYDKSLVYRIFKESSMLEESVVYQDILQKGEERGLLKGESRAATRLLERRFGKLSPTVKRRIEQLALPQLDDLCESLLDFQSKDELTRWLKEHAPAKS